MMHPKESRRDAILKAAAHLVREKGPAHLTMDAVSERARISKGGLLYHFQTKESLVAGMVERLTEAMEAVQEEEVAKLPPSPARELKALARSLQALRHGELKGVATALLAAGVHDPGLLEGIRSEQREMFQEMEAEGLRPAFVRVIFLAAKGLLLSEMLHSLALSDAERQAIFDELLRLIGEEEARMEAAEGAP